MSEQPSDPVADFHRQESERHYASLVAACYSLGQLRTLVEHPEWPTREQMLAEAVTDLNTALMGTEEEVAALVGRREAKQAAWLRSDEADPEAGEER